MIKKKQKKIQFLLMLIGSILVLGTYFYYPYFNNPKLTKNSVTEQDSTSDKKNNESSTFINVQYSGIYLNEPFTIESKTAYILSEKPQIVYMGDMRVLLNLKDKRTVEITSDEGRYNKKTYDIFFKKNVVATDGNSEFFSDNLDLLATKNFAKIYNNVNLNYENGSLLADSVLYDFQTKYFTVSMFDEDVIKMKVKNE
jgi:hypothetical protein